MEIKMMSLFDYLGRPAGKELGREIYRIAKYLGEKTTMRHVSTRSYSGKVVCYRSNFLEYIMTVPKIVEKVKNSNRVETPTFY